MPPEDTGVNLCSLWARLQILAALDGKVVIGHSVHNDFKVLDIAHPGHMVRDTSTSPLLSRLAGLSCRRSLKVLSRRLLKRRIQVSAGSPEEEAPHRSRF